MLIEPISGEGKGISLQKASQSPQQTYQTLHPKAPH